MSAGIGSVLGRAASKKGWLLDMSRFSGDAIQPSLVAGNTASALQVEALGGFIRKYLLHAHPPARLEACEAAELLGFHEDDMATLVREKLIVPLGQPVNNATKYFALADIEALGRSREGLSAATKAIYGRNKAKSQGVCAQDAVRNRLICEFSVGGN